MSLWSTFIEKLKKILTLKVFLLCDIAPLCLPVLRQRDEEVPWEERADAEPVEDGVDHAVGVGRGGHVQRLLHRGGMES